MRRIIFISCFLIFFVQTAKSQKELIINAGNPGAAISPNMWGVFFEDINFSADGGLYAELVKNRSFEFENPMMGWKEIKPQRTIGKILIINNGSKKPSNPRHAQVTVAASGYGLSNEGFRGMGIQKDKQYTFSLLGKKLMGDVRIRAELVNAKGEKIGEASLPSFSYEWSKQQITFTATGTDLKAHLNIFFEGKGTVGLDLISLFPKDTWKNRPNGLRPDLVQIIADLKPGFIRFPGGCIVEGYDLETRYQWKKTIGTPDSRQLNINRWNTEIRTRQAPDYYQTFGIGFYEYFQLAEDLGAEPLPILNCGMACQFNSKEVAPLDQIDPYIQDALDLVEFANGSPNTKWGKVRAAMGHPAPFNMKMLGVGNEQWDEQYVDRYKLFEKAFKTKYPLIKLIASSGPEPADERFVYAWKEFKKMAPAFVDEHYYKPPEWFLKNANRYDNYDRNGPKVFAGEYAAHDKEGKNSESRNTWMSALAEAAFMTGLERNADVVQMASYAPLLAHVDAWQWRPDLIWFDNLKAVGTPNYYVQKFFSTNKGTHVVPALIDGKIAGGKDGIYASAVWDNSTGEVIVKLVNIFTTASELNVKLDGKKAVARQASVLTLTAPEQESYNALSEPTKIYPSEQVVDIVDDKITLMLPPMSVYVLRVACSK